MRLDFGETGHDAAGGAAPIERASSRSDAVTRGRKS
jgi:hypothetical protein